MKIDWSEGERLDETVVGDGERKVVNCEGDHPPYIDVERPTRRARCLNLDLGV